MRVFIFLLLFISTHLNVFAKKVIVEIEIINPKNDEVKLIYNESYALYEFKEAKYSATVNYRNRVLFELELSAPKLVKLFYNKSETIFGMGHQYTELFLEPGDNFFIAIAPVGVKRIEGNNTAKANFKFLSKFNLEKRIVNPDLILQKNPGFTADDYLIKADSFKDEYLKILNLSVDISPAFRDFFLRKISYFTANNKFGFPSSKTMKIERYPDLPVHYYNFISDFKIPNDSDIFIEDYLTFIYYYIDYKFDNKQYNPKDHYAEQFKFAAEHLTGKTRDLELLTLFRINYDYLTPLKAKEFYTLFKNEVKDEELLKFADALTKKIKLLNVGDPAPFFKLKDINGSHVSLDDFRGKVIYVNFWASWCGPCKLELPHSVKLQDQFKDKEVVFLFISTDESEEQWRKAIREHNLKKGVHLISKETGENIQREYNVNGIPRYFLIDRDGNLLDLNASRPSDENTVNLLYEALNK